MRNLTIVDKSLPRVISKSNGHSFPTRFKWNHVDSINLIEDKSIVFYTDYCLNLSNKIGDIKIAWILEPEEFIPEIYDYIKKNYNEFDYILTRDRELLELNNKFLFYNPGNSWINISDEQIYPKNKLISMVASWKNFMSGHKIRHEILNRYKQKYNIHWYGKRGFEEDKNYIVPFNLDIQNPVENLADAYKDYMFTIIVENVIKDWEFTEKIVSPVLCGTVPIYYGCPSISKFLHPEGVLTFNSVDELDQILMNISEEKYKALKPHINNNFLLGQSYRSMQDNIYQSLLDKGIIYD